MSFDQAAYDLHLAQARAKHGLPAEGLNLAVFDFNEADHRRGIGGKFVKMLNGLEDGGKAELPGGAKVTKRGDSYKVERNDGLKAGDFDSPELAADSALKQSADSVHPDSLGGSRRFAKHTDAQKAHAAGPNSTAGPDKNGLLHPEEVTRLGENWHAHKNWSALKDSDLKKIAKDDGSSIPDGDVLAPTKPLKKQSAAEAKALLAHRAAEKKGLKREEPRKSFMVPDPPRPIGPRRKPQQIEGPDVSETPMADRIKRIRSFSKDDKRTDAEIQKGLEQSDAARGIKVPDTMPMSPDEADGGKNLTIGDKDLLKQAKSGDLDADEVRDLAMDAESSYTANELSNLADSMDGEGDNKDAKVDVVYGQLESMFGAGNVDVADDEVHVTNDDGTTFTAYVDADGDGGIEVEHNDEDGNVIQGFAGPDWEKDLKEYKDAGMTYDVERPDATNTPASPPAAKGQTPQEALDSIKDMDWGYGGGSVSDTAFMVSEPNDGRAGQDLHYRGEKQPDGSWKITARDRDSIPLPGSWSGPTALEDFKADYKKKGRHNTPPPTSGSGSGSGAPKYDTEDDFIKEWEKRTGQKADDQTQEILVDIWKENHSADVPDKVR